MKKYIPIAAVIVLVVIAAIVLVRCGGGGNNPTATVAPQVANVQTQQYVNTTAPVYDRPTLTPQPDIVDVTYQPASSSYPEMLIPDNGSRVCKFTNGDEVTFKSSGDKLTITSTLSHENFSITSAQVTQFDANGDKWVTLPNTGGVSVGYDSGGWHADWLRGCPSDAKTPDP